MASLSDFRTVGLLVNQPDEHLEWLASVCKDEIYEEGEAAVHNGDPAETMIFIMEGALQYFAIDRGVRALFSTWTAGEVTGLLPFSRMKTYQGEGIATKHLRIASLHKDYFPELMSRMPDVVQTLVGRMTDRVREAIRSDAQHDRMFALGKLSAGLAHELNNPAAAIKRAVADLVERLESMPRLVNRIVGHGLSPEQLALARETLSASEAATPGTVSALERSDQESSLGDWLEDHGVEQPFVVAEFLAEEGVTPEALDRLSDQVHADALGDVVLWIERGLGAKRMLAEVERAATRISDLVASVKAYSHLDQATDKQPIDVHAGLDSTLKMLGHSIKVDSIRVVQNYDEKLPPVSGHAGELNQVWTNLLDNAIDAVGQGGSIEIATRREGEIVCVTITDDGPGIPEELRGQIFDPFFSTKAPGEGTGLGLDIVNRIIRQHEGKINLKSRPGQTTFEVCLPVAEGA
jgi:signal transduction histidine kinase